MTDRSPPTDGAGPPKPKPLPVRERDLPPALAAFDQFVVWDYLLRDDRWTKPLYRVNGSGYAKSTDPAGWGSLRAALAASRSRRLAGIGFVLTSDDPFVFGDLDDCRDPATGELTPWAQAIVDRFRPSYQEVSPSGTGVKILIRGTLPGTEHRWRLDPDNPLAYVEWFDAAKYTTLTGHRLPGTGADVVDAQAELDELYRDCFPPASDTAPAPSVPSEVFVQLDDEALLAKARSARNGATFRRLFDDGDTAPYNHDESAADLALCDLLAFWLGNDPIRIDRVFRRSALMREKWERRAGYRKLTIDKALAGRTAFYSPPLPRRVLTPVPTDAPTTPADQSPTADTFDGPAWPELDEAMLDGIAGDVVFYLAPHTEADDVATLVTFLLLFGAACNRGPHYYVGEGRHGTNLFAVLVGNTSKARKGTSLDGPKRLVQMVDGTFVTERFVEGLVTGEGLIWQVHDDVVKSDKKGGTFVETPGIADKRLVSVEEEFAGMLAAADRPGATLSAVVRRAWDARGVLASTSKTSPGKATNPHIAILGHSTIEEIKRTLTDTAIANGFGNRFLWFLVRRSKELPHPGRLSDGDASSLAYAIGEALSFARQNAEFRQDPIARDLWASVYGPLSEGKPGLAGALMARGEAQVLRLSLLYALLDQAREIRENHLISALALWRYCEASIRYVFGEATGDPVADRVLTALRKNGPMPRTEIMELFGRHITSAQLGMGLETLVALGLAESTREKGNGGRVITTWQATSGPLNSLFSQ